MKTIKRILVICSVPFLLGACSTEEHRLLNASTEDVQEMLDSNQPGFVLIKDLEKEQTAMQFDVFRNDTSTENEDGLSNNPFRHNMLNVNTVYYINNGIVIEEYDLESNLDNQQESLEEFIEIAGDSHEQ